MLATIAVCTVNILTMAGHDDPVYHSSIMLSLIIEGIALIVTAAFILLCIYVRKAIVKPIRKISNELNNFSEGILSAEFDVKINDSDIGKLAGSLNTAKWYLKKMVDELTYLLTQMSYGNISFTINYDYKGEFTPIKSAFEQILVNLNDSFQEYRRQELCYTMPPSRYQAVRRRLHRAQVSRKPLSVSCQTMCRIFQAK